jgi:hypothetical protein
MITPEADHRSAERQAEDERIAAEPPRGPLDLPVGAPSSPMEKHLTRIRKRPVAVNGIVENGLVRPLDPEIKLPERARVIIVASEEA